jgi:uncharacterized BrkB/YihY/UPF0761 family membrane protein
VFLLLRANVIYTGLTALALTRSDLPRGRVSDFWRLTLLVVLLLFLACLGVAHILTPDWFIKHSGVRKGGELLTEWNRIQFQLLGAILTAFALFGLYALLSSL